METRTFPDLVSSGVFVVVDGIKLIITASHMFETPMCRLGFSYPGAEYFTHFADNLDEVGDPEKDVGMLCLHARQRPLEMGDEEYKDGLDIAAIEPTPKIINSLEEFYPRFDL